MALRFPYNVHQTGGPALGSAFAELRFTPPPVFEQRAEAAEESHEHSEFVKAIDPWSLDAHADRCHLGTDESES